MNTFKNKLIPSDIGRGEELTSQEDFCNNSSCENEHEIDCGNCLFSERFCKVEIFNEWLREVNNG